VTLRIRRAFLALVTVGAVVAVAGCGGGDGDEESSSGSTTDESTETTAEATTTTLSPEDEVKTDYAAAQEAIKAAYDPANPEHPDLLTHYAGPVLERHQTALAEYQLEGLSNVLLSKESDPEVTSLDDTTAVIEDCMTEVLQLTDTETRQPEGEAKTHTALIRADLELVEGTWTIVDARTIEEAC